MNCKHCGVEIKPCDFADVAIRKCRGFVHSDGSGHYCPANTREHEAEPEPASPVAQGSIPTTEERELLLAQFMASAPPSSPATSSKEIWAIVGMIHKIKGISDGAERQRWYDEISGILASPSGQAAAPTPENVYQLFKHKKDCTWVTPLPTGEGYWGCNCGLDSLLIGLEDFELADSFSPVSSDEQFWQFMEENAGIVKRWPGWQRVAAGLSAASPTGGAEPPQMAQVSSGIFTSKFCTCPNQADEDGAHCPICGKLKPETAAAEPNAEQWPSDLPANGMGAMNLITNFWTGDLKGLTKEGARIVDSLVAHVTKGMRTDVLRLETLVGQLEKIILKKDSDAAGLREQLEQANAARDEAKKDAESWKSHWRMYRDAWVRELGGWTVPKAHEIDSLVLTTRKRCVNPLLGYCGTPHWLGKPTEDRKALEQAPHPRGSSCKDWKVDDSEPNPRAEAAEAQLATAREALRKYARHRADCDALKGNPSDMQWPEHPRCNCGLRVAALAQAKEPQC